MSRRAKQKIVKRNRNKNWNSRKKFTPPQQQHSSCLRQKVKKNSTTIFKVMIFLIYWVLVLKMIQILIHSVCEYNTTFATICNRKMMRNFVSNEPNRNLLLRGKDQTSSCICSFCAAFILNCNGFKKFHWWFYKKNTKKEKKDTYKLRRRSIK